MTQNLKLSVLIVGLLCVLSMSAQTTAPKYTEFYYQRESLFNELPVDSTNIVMLGNSLTNGAEWHELFANPKVINRGITGDTAQGILDRMEPIISGNPAKIFLLTGANDISHHLTADSISTAIVELVQYIRRNTPDTKVYVQSVLPINNEFGRYKNMIGKEPVVSDVNKMLQEKLKDYDVVWLNVNPLFADENGNLRKDLTNDGLHLLGPAYIMWRDFLLPYINE